MLGYNPAQVKNRSENRKRVSQDKAARLANQSRKTILDKLQKLMEKAEKTADDSTALRALDQQAKILHLYSEKAFALDATKPIFIVINTRQYRDMEVKNEENTEDETIPENEAADNSPTGDDEDDPPGTDEAQHQPDNEDEI